MTISNEATRGMATCECHHWVSTNVPGLITRWVIQCSLCGAYNIEEMNAAHRAALEAAAPIIRAECLEEAADELRKWWEERMDHDPAVELTDTEHGTQNGTTDGIGAAEKLLRARAADERTPPVSARDLLGIAPDFTGGLTVDEYMDEQRERGRQ